MSEIKLKKRIITLVLVFCPRLKEIVDVATNCNVCEFKAGEEWDVILCRYKEERNSRRG